MSNTSFPVGCRVRDSVDPATKGTVIGHPLKNTELVAVEWDNGELQKVSTTSGEIILVNTALEADFNKIAEKIKEASAAINEANLLAKKNKTDLNTLHYDGEVDCRDMFSALDNAGWSASSMRC
jgi:hypothetical protein